MPDNTSYDQSVHLSFGDIALDDLKNPTVLQVCIKQSKTDRCNSVRRSNWRESVPSGGGAELPGAEGMAAGTIISVSELETLDKISLCRSGQRGTGEIWPR